MREPDSRPFYDLPSAMVDELLDRSTVAGKRILERLRRYAAEREILRRRLRDLALVARKEALPPVPAPTTAATDGSYAVERLLGVDFLATAAVAVEGITPPGETRYWPEPRHRVYLEEAPHDEGSSVVLRAYMLGLELSLAMEAPHQVVFLDGSITLPVIYWNQALVRLVSTRLEVAERFRDELELFLHLYRLVLRAGRSDRQMVALPKYSTRRELAERLGVEADDRALLSLLLEAGEYTVPLSFEQPRSPWHLGLERLPDPLQKRLKPLVKEVLPSLNEVRVVYYRPRPWLPALRIEMAAAIAKNPQRLATVLEAVANQCQVPSMLEPYPLYLADRLVKSLPRSIPTFRQVATQAVAEGYGGDLGEVYFALHGYRSESGG